MFKIQTDKYMKIMRLLFTGICFLFSFHTIETIAVTLDNGGKREKIKESFYYALPENYFTVTVVIDKISTYKGPLLNHAGKIPGLSSLVKEDAVQYVISRISLEEHARIDLQHVYYVEVPDANVIPYHRLYKDLLLSNYNTTAKSSWQNRQFPDMENTLAQTQNHFSIYTTDATVEKYDTTYVPEVFDTIIVYIPKITKRLVAKPTQQQASEAIKAIENIREARLLLINGDHETDYSNLELMLSELQKKEDEYLSLFKGITEKEELSYTFTVLPSQKGSVITLPLFRFSDKYGIGDGVEVVEKVNYTLRFTSKGIHEAVEAADKKFRESKLYKKGKKGDNHSLYYRKPQYYTVSLYKGNDLVQDFGVYPISQFGETVPLPLKTSSFEMDSLTGSLKYIEITE